MRALVVGGGFAGVAAAWALSRRQSSVDLVWDGEGSSVLYSGALDFRHWQVARGPLPVTGPVSEFLATIAAWAPPTSRSLRVASSAGLVRRARCRDRAVLDLRPLAGRQVAVVDLGRPAFDAESMAWQLSAAAWSRKKGTRFEVARVEPPDARRARWLSDADLARDFDDPELRRRLAERLREVPGDALLFGPWLGLELGSAEDLSERVGRPLGEILSDPGAAAGRRFERARDAWLASSSVSVRRGRVASVTREGSRLVARLQAGADEAARSEPAAYDAVVLAVGGVASGGIRYLSGEPGPKGRSLSLSLDSPVNLRLGGREVALSSGALGVDLQRLGFEALRAVGLSVDGAQRADPPNLFAAGDVVAARPRTALEAVRAGIEAAHSAAELMPRSTETRAR